ncbi:MAG TPA: polysaccharide deacetylase family protein [Polyangia bacterium]|jgi:peptidoglycan/xylan/chitin deacetylase (PgdA/CDA1 family)|nr:polysaccharide deacetylase family protein [Polyangia bacterium]
MSWAYGRVPHLLREVVKSTLAVTTHTSGLLSLTAAMRRQWHGPVVHILAFHRVVDDVERLPEGVIRSLCISTRNFERLCRAVTRHFEVLSLEAAAAVVSGLRTLRRDGVVITFDDGYRDVYLRAWPILERYGIPATAFVPSGYIDTEQLLEHDRLHALLVLARRKRMDLAALGGDLSRPLLLEVNTLLQSSLPAAPAVALDHLIAGLPTELLMALGDDLEERLGSPCLDEGSYVMSAGELSAIARGGIEIGAHTVHHVTLVHEPPERVRRELEEPRHRIEALTGRSCRAFAYCNGLWHPALVQAVRAAGYRVAVTTCDQLNLLGQNPLLLGRKTLCEGHVRGLGGTYSEARTLAHLHHLYGALGLSRPVSGETRGVLRGELMGGPDGGKGPRQAVA